MKPKVINPLKAILIFGTMIFLGCQSPVTSVYHGPSSNASLGKGLTVSWSSPSTSARTIMPSSFPTPSSYNISLTPTSGSPVTQTGVTSTSWTFSNLTPSVYAVTVVGLDGSGNTIVQGASSVDTTTNSSASVSVTLNYALTGTGTGQINLTLNLASAGVGSTTATVKLVDPSGNISSPTLVGSGTPGSNYTYTNTTAAVGSWQAFFMVKTGTQTAMKMESILVFQNVPTTATLTFVSTGFTAPYVAVAGVSFSPSNFTLAPFATTALSPTISPSNASDQLLSWSSSNVNVATVSQTGLVTAVGLGTSTITATSVDNPTQSATTTATVCYTLTFDSQSADVPATPSTVQVLTSALTTNQLPSLPVKSGYTFEGWFTGPCGTGNVVGAGSTIVQNLTLYAWWLDIVAGNGMKGYSGDNGIATSAELNNPSGVAVDSSGNLYISDTGNNRVRKVDTNGIISTIAGNGIGGYSGDNGPATLATLHSPQGIAVDGQGNLYIADILNSCVRKVSSTGTITTFAGAPGLQGFLGDGASATSALLSNPTGVAVDSTGNVYIADTGNHRIRMVDTTGIIHTFAGNGAPYFLGGMIYYFGDNGLATAAELASPISVAVDPAGNVYIADSVDLRIRKVATNGIISSALAGALFGNPNISDTTAQQIYTGAGSWSNAGVTVDTNDNVYVSGLNAKVSKYFQYKNFFAGTATGVIDSVGNLYGINGSIVFREAGQGSGVGP